MNSKGKISIVGFGPGSHNHLTFEAHKAIQEADTVVGYSTYIQLVEGLLHGKEVIQAGMTEEIDRAKTAVSLALEGKKVAVVSSGDAGIYGMAGIIYEYIAHERFNLEKDIQVEVVPGVTALSAVASLLGAPLMHDFVSISLSDLLTPLEVIYRRVEHAAAGDFVIALYNPQSKRRVHQIRDSRDIILKYRDPKTPVGIVKSAYRDSQNIVVTDLENMLEHEIGMLTTIIIGNSTTFTYQNRMITPRGYQNKYDLESGTAREGQKAGRSLMTEVK